MVYLMESASRELPILDDLVDSTSLCYVFKQGEWPISVDGEFQGGVECSAVAISAWDTPESFAPRLVGGSGCRHPRPAEQGVLQRGTQAGVPRVRALRCPAGASQGPHAAGLRGAFPETVLPLNLADALAKSL